MKDFEFGCFNCGGPVKLVYLRPTDLGDAFECDLAAKCATPPCTQMMYLVPEFRVASGSFHAAKMREAEKTP